jgi:hypothetical protein
MTAGLKRRRIGNDQKASQHHDQPAAGGDRIVERGRAEPAAGA